MDKASQITFQDFDNWLIEQAKALPVPRGDRAAQASGQQATQQAGAGGQQLLGEAAGIFGPLTKANFNMLQAPPGFGAAYGTMLSQAGAQGSGETAALQQQAAQRAANTGNIAGVGAAQDAIAEQVSQGTGANLQNIAIQNQFLKNQQQQQAASNLQGIYGTTLGGGVNLLGQQAPDINAWTNAGKSGWVQNLEGLVGTFTGGRGFGGSAGGVTICYVAAELYGGWLTPEVNDIRRWLTTTWWVQPFTAIYRLLGPQWAKAIQRNRALRRITKKLFDWFLERAQQQ